MGETALQIGMDLQDFFEGLDFSYITRGEDQMWKRDLLRRCSTILYPGTDRTRHIEITVMENNTEIIFRYRDRVLAAALNHFITGSELSVNAYEDILKSTLTVPFTEVTTRFPLWYAQCLENSKKAVYCLSRLKDAVSKIINEMYFEPDIVNQITIV